MDRLAAAAPLGDALADLERKSGGRLGVCVLDTRSKRRLTHRADERFAMCSTFKLPLAAAVLRRANEGSLKLDTFVPYTKADMVMHAPVTEPNLAKGGMTILGLVEAAQKQSDNVAANLLLKQVGGPAGLTQFLRGLGDQVTRLDRYEPELNDVPPGDLRDTTSPNAMAMTVEKIATGDTLDPASRERLIQLMIDTTTGSKRIRAGLPKDWRAGDKTGTAANGTSGKYNDVACVWPPGSAPIIIAAYYTTPSNSNEVRDEDQAILAEVGRIAVAWLGN